MKRDELLFARRRIFEVIVNTLENLERTDSHDPIAFMQLQTLCDVHAATCREFDDSNLLHGAEVYLESIGENLVFIVDHADEPEAVIQEAKIALTSLGTIQEEVDS